MAIHRIDQIEDGGEVYKFVDSESQQQIVELTGRVNTLYGLNDEKIAQEITRAQEAEAAILESQVSKEPGKGLSSNDYTDEDKAKVDRIQDMKGCTQTEDGEAGFVPAPPAGYPNYFLNSSGQWVEVQGLNYEDATQTVHGLMSVADKIKLDTLDYTKDDQYGSTTTISGNKITQTIANGKQRVIEFKDNGTIEETITPVIGNKIRLRTKFDGNVIRKEVIS